MATESYKGGALLIHKPLFLKTLGSSHGRYDLEQSLSSRQVCFPCEKPVVLEPLWPSFLQPPALHYSVSANIFNGSRSAILKHSAGEHHTTNARDRL